MISVYLVDDHSVVRAGFRRLLENEGDISVVGEADSGEGAYQECLDLKPDIIVVDISMPGEGGFSFMRRLLAEDSNIRLLVMSMHAEPIYLTNALQLGVKGYISKSGDPEELITAVRKIARGENWVSPKLAQEAIYNLDTSKQSSIENLTTREFEVFILLSEGKSVIEIGKALQISPKTVNVHRAKILDKLGAKNAVELAHIAVRLGVVQA